ncbi:MAG: hypothetical protein NZ954_08720 [Thermofilaceae archaeon]|nr:hypothetical protein [Thermofilaceae archaeon]
MYALKSFNSFPVASEHFAQSHDELDKLRLSILSQLHPTSPLPIHFIVSLIAFNSFPVASSFDTSFTRSCKKSFNSFPVASVNSR